MIVLKDVSAGYGGKAVVSHVDLEFRPGEVLVLLGPNGSGKTTLLKAALGLIPAMDGEILYNGQNTRTMKAKQIARQAAYLTQSRNTPSITALKLVLHGRFPYISYPRSYSDLDRSLARKAMEETETSPFENTNVTLLSGGQRQGVYLAMTLAQDTETVFMDEPTTYLDIGRRLRTLRTARELAASGKAVVLVLHDLDLALRCADRIAVLREGKLLGVDSPEGIYESGILGEAFGVEVHRMDTPHGPQYYCIEREVP